MHRSGLINRLASVLVALLFLLPGLAAAQQREIITYLHPDITGSPVMATDAAGNVLWKERYAPYGERQVNADDGRNSLWFTGKGQDAQTGLSYFGARWYDPLTGRFTGVDPVSFAESNPHSFNRYAYANNNPYKFKDPDGQVAETIIDAVSLALSIAAYRAEPSLLNALGVVYDGVALAVPVLPAIGIIRHADAVTDAASALSQMKGMGAAEREKLLTKSGFALESVSNSAGKNELWKHPDGSTVLVHPYGNVKQTPHKSANNAHLHKLDKHGNALDDRGIISTDPNRTHIGVPNRRDHPEVRNRPHGS
jgi:RHS repeat-associated protein